MKVLTLIAAGLIAVTLSGCRDDVDIASHNISKEANNFNVNRRTVFYNGINGD